MTLRMGSDRIPTMLKIIVHEHVDEDEIEQKKVPGYFVWGTVPDEP